jgi:hypothetical protein
MKQTAVEWLQETLECFGNKHKLEMSWATLDELFDQAKEMHKEEIMDAFWNGDNSDCTSEQNAKEFAEEYYEKTFNTKEK